MPNINRTHSPPQSLLPRLPPGEDQAAGRVAARKVPAWSWRWIGREPPTETSRSPFPAVADTGSCEEPTGVTTHHPGDGRRSRAVGLWSAPSCANFTYS